MQKFLKLRGSLWWLQKMMQKWYFSMNWRHFRFEKWRFRFRKKAWKKVCMIMAVWTRKIVIVKHKKYCCNKNCCNKNCNSNVDFVEKMAKIPDLDACGLWRLWTLRKVSILCSIDHFSYRTWKYESNGSRVEIVKAVLA